MLTFQINLFLSYVSPLPTLNRLTPVVGQEQGCSQPAGPQGDMDHHQEEDVPPLPVVLPDVLAPHGQDGDGRDKEDDVGEGEDVVGGGVGAVGDHHHPLHPDHQLDEDTEEEEEGLVHGGQVDPGVEGDEEDLLDQEGGVDEDIGEARAEPDGHTGGDGLVQGVDEAKGGAKEEAKEKGLGEEEVASAW